MGYFNIKLENFETKATYIEQYNQNNQTLVALLDNKQKIKSYLN